MFRDRTAAVVCRVVIGGALSLTLIGQTNGQVLDELRHDIRDGTGASGNSPPSSPSDQNLKSAPDSSGNPSSSSDPTADDDLGIVFWEAVGLAVAAPYWAPFRLLDDDFGVPNYFLRYPYWHDEPGSMFTVSAPGARHRTWETEWAFEYSDDLDDLSRLGGHFRLSTTSRIDIETNWNTFTEQTPRGDDHVTIGDVDLLFRFAQSDRVQLRSGLGANWFDDHQGIVGGFNFRYGVDYFPGHPWHLTALFDLGELGKAGLVHLRTTAGLTVARWEAYTGYDYRRIGHVEFGGPVAGVEFRF